MFGFLLNLFNSDLDNNRENDRDEELNRSAIEIWQKDNDWKYDYQDEDLWDNFLGQGYDYEYDTENIDMDVFRSINHLNKKRKAEAWQDMESGYIDRQDEDEENH